MSIAGPSTPPLLTISPLRDRESRPILLLHTAGLPSMHDSPESISRRIHPTLARLPPTGPLTLVVLHAALASSTGTTLAGMRAFRAAYENPTILPHPIRQRIQLILALHVSVLTRAHVYMASFAMQFRDYQKLKYCDLLADLETTLAVDSTLLGLNKIDFDYDHQMRFWVGRQHEENPVIPPDPRKPLLDLDNVAITPDHVTPQEQAEHHASQLAQP